MKKENLLDKFKNKISSLGWKLFIWGLGITKEEYWERIYQQEKQFKNQAKEIEKQQQDKFAIDFFNWCNSEDAADLLHDLIMVGEVEKNVTIEQILEIYKNK